MDTPFERLDNDAKEDWRNLPATRAFLATLAGHYESRGQQALLGLASPASDIDTLRVNGGELVGLMFALNMLRSG